MSTAAPTSLAQQKVDVQLEIWPVLRKSCLHCHDKHQSEGQFRLDRKSWIERGGHTGSVILGTPDNSELLRRLQSTDANYRMPKDESPLSSDVVETFKQWIEQGAPWPDDHALVADKVVKDDRSLWTRRYDRALEIREGLKLLAWPALFLMGLLLVLERRKRSLGDRDSKQLGILDRLASKVCMSHYLSVMLMLVMIAIWMFHRSEVARLESNNRKSIALLERFNISDERLSPNDHTYYPQPDPPRHPRRLGGTYYRGNDERHPGLFNGGYYRTATMRLSLRDRRDKKLEWADRVEPGQLVACLEIERAPFTTRELFREDLMVHNRMTRHLGGEETRAMGDLIVNFETIEAGERWRACYPVGEPSLHGEEIFSGMIYVCNIHGNAHYGIGYEIELQDGEISDESQLWMGATFFTGDFIRPPTDVMSSHEWFGFLPLPEIVGGNTSDPDLLGIPEHKNDAQSPR